jgi:pyrroloquinoline-quinone synthase
MLAPPPTAAAASRIPPLPPEAFEAWLRGEGALRYDDEHPFHARMQDGGLTRDEIRAWVRNRYYFQTRLAVADALVVAKAEDSAFRRAWLRRVVEHDGDVDGDGALAAWRRLGLAVGLDEGELARHDAVLPGVRFACDAYVELVRRATLAEAVATSLTEVFAPKVLARCIAAWETHYAWVPSEALLPFWLRLRVAGRDGAEALAFVRGAATTYEAQARCVAALVDRCEIAWHLLDCVQAASRVDTPPSPALALHAA